MLLRRLIAGCFRNEEVELAKGRKSCASCVTSDVPYEDNNKSNASQANEGSRCFVGGQDITQEVLPTFHEAAFHEALDQCKGLAAAAACTIESGCLPVRGPELKFALPRLRTLWLHVHAGSESGNNTPAGRSQRLYESYLKDLESFTAHDEAILASVETAARCAVKQQYCKIRHRIRLDGSMVTTVRPGSRKHAAQCAMLEVGSCLLDMGPGQCRPGLILIIRAPAAWTAAGPAAEACGVIKYSQRASLLPLKRAHSGPVPWRIPQLPQCPRGGVSFSNGCGDRDLDRVAQLPHMKRAASASETIVTPGDRRMSIDDTMLAARALAAESIPAMVMAFSLDRSGAGGSIIYVNQLARSYLNIPLGAEVRHFAGTLGDNCVPFGMGCSIGGGVSSNLEGGGWQLPQLDVRLLLLELLSGAGLELEELLSKASQQQGFSATLKAPDAMNLAALVNGCVTAHGAPTGINNIVDITDSMYRGVSGAARPRLLMNGIAECDEMELQEPMDDEPPPGDSADEDGVEIGTCGSCSDGHPSRGHRARQSEGRDSGLPPLEREASISTSDGQSTPVLPGAARPGSFALMGTSQRQSSVTSSVGVGHLVIRTESFALPSRMDSNCMMHPAASTVPASAVSASTSFSCGHMHRQGLGCLTEALRQRLEGTAAAAAVQNAAEQLLLQRLTKTTVARQARDVTFQRVASFHRQNTSPAGMSFALSPESSDRGGAEPQQQRKTQRTISSTVPQVPSQATGFVLQRQHQMALRIAVAANNSGGGDRGGDTDPGASTCGGGGITMGAAFSGGFLDSPVSTRRHLESTLTGNGPLPLLHDSPQGSPNTSQLRRQASCIEAEAASLRPTPLPSSALRPGSPTPTAAPWPALSAARSVVSFGVDGRSRRGLRRVCTSASSELAMRVGALGRSALAPLSLGSNSFSGSQSMPALGPESGVSAVAAAAARINSRELLRSPDLGESQGGNRGAPLSLPLGVASSGDLPIPGLRRRAYLAMSHDRRHTSIKEGLVEKGAIAKRGPTQAANCFPITSDRETAAARPSGGSRPTALPAASPDMSPQSLQVTLRDEEPAGSVDAAITADCYTGLSATGFLSPWGLQSSESAQAGSSYTFTDPCGPRGCATTEESSVPLLARASGPLLASAAGGARTKRLGILRTVQQLATVSNAHKSTDVFTHVYGTVAAAAQADTCRRERREDDNGTEGDNPLGAELRSEHTMPLAQSLSLPQDIYGGDAAAATAPDGAEISCRSTAVTLPNLSPATAISTTDADVPVHRDMIGQPQARVPGPVAHCGNSWLPLYPVSAEGTSNKSQSHVGSQAEANTRHGQSHSRYVIPGPLHVHGQLRPPLSDAGGICLAAGSSGGVNIGGGSSRGGVPGVHSCSLVSSCWLSPAVPAVRGSSGQLADLGQRVAIASSERGGRFVAGMANSSVGVGRASIGYPSLMLRGGSTSQHPGLPMGSPLGSTMIDGSIGDIGSATVAGSGAQSYCKMGTTAGCGSGGVGGGTGDNSVNAASAIVASVLSTGDRSLMSKLVGTAGTIDSSNGGDVSRGVESAHALGGGSGRVVSNVGGLSQGRFAQLGVSGSRLTELVSSSSGAVAIPKRPSSIPRGCSRLHTGPAALGSGTPQRRPNSVRARLCSLLEQMDRDNGFGGIGGDASLGGMSPTGIAGGGGSGGGGSGGGGSGGGGSGGGGSGTSAVVGFMLNGSRNTHGRRASAVMSTSASRLAPLLPARRASTTILERSRNGVPYSGSHMMGLEAMPPCVVGPVAGGVPPLRASFCSAASSDIQSGASRLLLLNTRASSIGPSHPSHAPHLRDLHHLSHSHVNTNTSDGSQNNTAHSLALQLRLMTSGGVHSQGHYQQHLTPSPVQHLGCGNSGAQIGTLGGVDTSMCQGLVLGPPDIPVTNRPAALRNSVSASASANALAAASGSPNWVLPFHVQTIQGLASSPVRQSAGFGMPSGGTVISDCMALRHIATPPASSGPTEGPGAPAHSSGLERHMNEWTPSRPGSGLASRMGSAVCSSSVRAGPASPGGDSPRDVRGAMSPELAGLGSGAVSSTTCWFRVHMRSFSAPNWPTGNCDLGLAAATAGEGGEGGEADTGTTTLVLVMQDVTAHMTAQERVAALLGHEHKILEALFPRHVIEFMTVVPVEMAAAGVRGRAGGAAKSRARSHRNLAASPVTDSPVSSRPPTVNRSASAEAKLTNAAVDEVPAHDSDDGGEETNTGFDAAHSSLAVGDGAGEGLRSGSSSSCRGSGWRQLVMQQQLDAIKVSHLATQHKMVTILFSDCVGFTAMCKKVSPLAVMHFLNELYQKLDALLDIYKVYKVETIGDCYVVAGGLVRYDSDGYCSVLPEGEVDELHAVRVMEFGKAMLRASREVALPTTGEPVEMRLGLHSGPAMSGVVGSKMPRFTVFGETVEAAHRMESSGKPGRIHVSGVTKALLRSETWEQTEGVQIDGGKRMDTYLWVEGKDEDELYKQRVMAVYI